MIDIINTASQTREYKSKNLGVIPGGGGRPRRFNREASYAGREAMMLQYQTKVSAPPFYEAGTTQNAII